MCCIPYTEKRMHSEIAETQREITNIVENDVALADIGEQQCDLSLIVTRGILENFFDNLQHGSDSGATSDHADAFVGVWLVLKLVEWAFALRTYKQLKVNSRNSHKQKKEKDKRERVIYVSSAWTSAKSPSKNSNSYERDGSTTWQKKSSSVYRDERRRTFLALE